MANEFLNVSDVTPRVAYTATAAQTAFVVPFIFFEDSNLKVYQNGVLKTLATHYTVAGAEEQSGTVTLLTGATLADEIMIVREVPLEQTTHVPPSGPLDIPAINIQFSKFTTMIQEQAHGLARSIRLADNLPGELEIATPVASEFLKWNATADGVESAAVVTPAGSYAIATESEAVAGALNNVLMTPLRVKQAAATVVSDSAPGIMAWDNNVPGDGTDQTARLQALIDAAPTSAAKIYMRGSIGLASQLNLTGRNNLTFVGAHTNGVRASIDVTTGATGGEPAIKAYGTVTVGFEDINIRQYNAAFDGHVLSYGAATPTAESAYMRLKDCFFTTVTTSAKALSLNASTNGKYENVIFQGFGTLVNLKQTSAGYANVHQFANCTFQPGVAHPPVVGAGSCINFYGCCFQAGSTGQTLAWQCNSGHQFSNVNFHGCDFLDATLSANPWIIAPWGNGLTITGCYMGGPGGAISLGGAGSGDPQDSGARGIIITGNSFGGVTYAIGFGGTIAAKDNVRGVYIGGNTVTNGYLMSSTAQVEQMVLLPNSIYGAPLELGAHFGLIGIPSYASNAAAISAGLVTGQVYKVGNILQIV